MGKLPTDSDKTESLHIEGEECLSYCSRQKHCFVENKIVVWMEFVVDVQTFTI